MQNAKCKMEKQTGRMLATGKVKMRRWKIINQFNIANEATQKCEPHK